MGEKRLSMNEQEKLIEECLLSGEEIDAIEEEIAKDPMKELYIGRGHCGVIYDALLKAQLEKVKGYVQQQVEAAKKEERERIVNEVETHSHRINTNMYGISLTKDEWEKIKQEGK